MEVTESLIRMFSALAVVLGLVGAAAFLGRRFLTGRSAGHGGRPLVEILGTGCLGPRKTISLVSVAGELLIVGATADALIPLGRIEDPERIRQVSASYAPTTTATEPRR